MSTKEYQLRYTQLTVLPKGEPIFSEMATVVEITDDAAGEYVSVEQHIDNCNKVRIAPEEWPVIKEAIELMISHCRPAKETSV